MLPIGRALGAPLIKQPTRRAPLVPKAGLLRAYCGLTAGFGGSLLGWATGLLNLKLVMELANPLLTA